jgi:hypothetical protein
VLAAQPKRSPSLSCATTTVTRRPPRPPMPCYARDYLKPSLTDGELSPDELSAIRDYGSRLFTRPGLVSAGRSRGCPSLLGPRALDVPQAQETHDPADDEDRAGQEESELESPEE